uniref:Uncharacterized protein n=1 Tax=Anguilla anguilla TaxID=7936 RepID=A0A0E9WG10_ANGAN
MSSLHNIQQHCIQHITNVDMLWLHLSMAHVMLSVKPLYNSMLILRHPF